MGGSGSGRGGGTRGAAAPPAGTASRARASRMLGNSTDTRGHAYLFQSGSFCPGSCEAAGTQPPRRDSASLTFTQEYKKWVPLKCKLHPGCFKASTDRSAVSALKRLQKQGHCEHRGGVEKHHGFLEDHKSLKSKRSRERETRGKEKKKGGKKQKALPSSKGPPLAKVSSHC